MHNSTKFPPGSIVYNVTDHEGQCFTGYCNDTCHVDLIMYPCVTSPPKKPCLYVKPPRKDGESWNIDDCSIATCRDGDIIVKPRECPPVARLVCENKFPPVKVYDEDGCCFHYECQCLCYGWGDPHYVTFDGKYYGFQGNCTYWLVKEIIPKYNFNVMIHNYYCGHGLSCPESITIIYKGLTIYIIQTQNNGAVRNKITVNNKAILSPAYKTTDFRITTVGIKTVVTIPKINAKITFAGLIFSIKLPYNKFSGNTEGQCGTCDNNQKNDCRLPGGKIDPSCPNMAHEWHVNHTHCEPPVMPTPGPSPTPCNTSICDVIKSSVFTECHKLIPYDPFILGCEFDVCNMHDDHVGCTSIEMYADACADAGLCVDWRSSTHGLCDYTCPSPKVYKACGPPVEVTCDTRYSNTLKYYSIHQSTPANTNKQPLGLKGTT
ncbi:intestinal mucin-like protein [Sphaeramia orbicularis]|uniref:intestinal mucin-like protein n=1 Tax=Sphaeramia orbicularis TaxID=375764 RepID=UPI00117E03D6|nr:intestinal mucin-like protein [Sphaeramia orbicularis]